MKKKNLAFTLAEVHIVIGIIGVDAALTLPNLNHATGDKERVTKVNKIYSTLTEALDRAQVIYGDYDTWFGDLSTLQEKSERFAKRVTEFMKISKDCGYAGQGCFSSDTGKTLDSSYTQGIGPMPDSGYRLITSDNMSLIFKGINSYITVDIDGPNKGENTFGKDLFNFYINDDNILSSKMTSGPGPAPLYFGLAAANWILENDNADYLKADSNLKCNDSNIILNGTTNTSCH